MLYGTTVWKSYIETKFDNTAIMEIPDGEGGTNAYFSIYLMMDDEHRVTERKASTFPMAFSATGGFMTITFLLTFWIVSRLQTIIYQTSLIRNFYTYQPSKASDSEANYSIPKHARLHNQLLSRIPLNYRTVDYLKHKFKQFMSICLCKMFTFDLADFKLYK